MNSSKKTLNEWKYNFFDDLNEGRTKKPYPEDVNIQIERLVEQYLPDETLLDAIKALRGGGIKASGEIHIIDSGYQRVASFDVRCGIIQRGRVSKTGTYRPKAPFAWIFEECFRNTVVSFRKSKHEERTVSNEESDCDVAGGGAAPGNGHEPAGMAQDQ